MTGSLSSKRGKYYAVLNTKDPGNPKKRRQKWVNLGIADKPGNKARAKQKLRELLVELDKAGIIYVFNDVMPIVPEMVNPLFCDYVNVWLDDKKKEVEQTSYEFYQGVINKHVYPYFQKLGLYVADVTKTHIQKYYDVKGKKLSANTLHKHHAIINQALAMAVRNDIIPFNPASGVVLPKIERYQGKFLSQQQGEKLLEAAEGSNVEIVVILGMMYRLRRSEIAGLKWDAVDFNNDTITIRHTIVRVKTVVRKDRAKNKTSNRTLPLLPEVKDFLLQVREKQEQDKKLCGDSYADTPYICRWEDGTAMTCEYLSKKFKDLLKECDLPDDVRLHDLRHTCASFMLKANVNMKVISDTLGHSQISTTMDIYGHIDLEDKNDALSKVGSMLKKKC